MSKKLVYFAHGKESGPWGSKIQHLANVARDQGFAVESPDYSDTYDPQLRLQRLLQVNPQAQHLVLVGSSMGGYVSAMACKQLQPHALLLLAPALYFDEYPGEPEGCPTDTEVVHGWRDDIVPPESAIRFARSRRASLHMLDDEHRLANSLETIGAIFARQLKRVIA